MKTAALKTFLMHKIFAQISSIQCAVGLNAGMVGLLKVSFIFTFLERLIILYFFVFVVYFLYFILLS